MTWRLITIPISHYCDKARWALDRAGVAYVEDGHVPMFHWRAAKAVQGTRTVPILVHDTGAATDSTDILHLVDTRLPADLRLFPEDPTLRAAVETWEERFDRSLGPAARRWAYFHLLADAALTVQMVGQGAPAWESHATRLVFPLYAGLMRRGLKITPSKSRQSLEKVRAILDDVTAALADGRRYLVGDRLTAADLTFATLAAPALLPDDHPAFQVPWASIPPAMRTEVEALRSTPAGQFALRLYREDRRVRVA